MICLLIISIICNVAILFITCSIYRGKNRTTKKTHTEITKETLTDELIEEKIKEAFQLLKIECNPDQKKGKEYILHIDYQNAHFILNYKNAQSQGIDIIFPFFYNDKVDYIDTIRSFCNRMNNYHSPIVVTYTTSKDQVYLNASTNISAQLSAQQISQEFTQCTALFFSYQRDFIASLTDDLSKVKKYDVPDMEYHNSCEEKMTQLVQETTLRVEQDDLLLPDEFLRNHNTLSIEELLTWIPFANPSTLTRMEVVCGTNRFSCDIPEKIRSYKLCSPLLGPEQDKDTPQHFVHQEAILKLYYQKNVSTGQDTVSHPEQVLYLMLKASTVTPHTLFYQVTLCQPENKLANIPMSSLYKSLYEQNAVTLLLGYELKTPNQQKVEFDFMYNDIDDKIAEGHSSELTPEQMVIYGISNPDVAFFSYWGKRLIRDERYLDALTRLHQAWNLLNRAYEQLKKNDRLKFYDISALIGLCLYKLNMPKTALYYYHLATECENSQYYCMSIKCMIAANDPGGLKYVETSLQDTRNHILELQEDEDEVPDTLTHIYHFLRRAKAQILFQRQYLEQAEKLCQEMLKEPENANFALTLLDLIRQQKDNDIQ